MGFYRDRILPSAIDLAMRNPHLRPYRERVARAAEGRVLEVGIGSGLNLALYGPLVQEVLGLDPSSASLGRAGDRAKSKPNAVQDRLRLLGASAEAIPLSDRSIDTAVMTWVGCSIPDAAAALGEMRRVLKPTGRILFVAPDPKVARWQDRVTPVWRLLAGGCRLNRQIDRIIADAGFRIDRLQTGYIPGPRIMTFLYEGAAVPR
jgi:ubiquinone/menaquinone biosynthesis C-methylase UbiE